MTAYSPVMRWQANQDMQKAQPKPNDRLQSTPMKMTLPHNTRSEPANRQRTRSPSMDSVKKNLSASLIACDTFCPGECYSPVRRSRSPIRGVRSPVHYSPVRRYRSPVRNVDTSVAHKTSSTTAQQEVTTLQKQRRELELLIAELRDRDRELNEMTATHQQQLQAWQQDRAKLAALQQKCAALEENLLQRNGEYRQLVAKLHIAECSEQNRKTALENTQHQLIQLTEQNSQSGLHLEQIQDENASLNNSVRNLSGNVSELETHETKLRDLLQHKERDLEEATDHIADLCGKLKRFTAQYRDCKTIAQTSRQQLAECRRKLIATEQSWQLCKKEAERREQSYQEQQSTMEKLKQELTAAKAEVILISDREKRKEQLLMMQRSKQERTDNELTNLRELYERQQTDFSDLHQNLRDTNYLLPTSKRQKSPTISADVESQSGAMLPASVLGVEAGAAQLTAAPPSGYSTPSASTPNGFPSSRSSRSSFHSTPRAPSYNSHVPVSTQSSDAAPSSLASDVSGHKAPPVRLTTRPPASALACSVSQRHYAASRLPISNERRASLPCGLLAGCSPLPRCSDSPAAVGPAGGAEKRASVSADTSLVYTSTSDDAFELTPPSVQVMQAVMIKPQANTPVSKLQRLLTESSELVYDLEQSAMTVNSMENIHSENRPPNERIEETE